MKKIVVNNRKELQELIKRNIEVFGNECNLNFIDTSQITDMSYLFHESRFNGNISDWDVSNVTNMNSMFWNAKFNNDISDWDVSNVEDMNYMFARSKFNQDISNWDVSNVIKIDYIFYNSIFNQDISNWKHMLGTYDKYQCFVNSPLENNPPFFNIKE